MIFESPLQTLLESVPILGLSLVDLMSTNAVIVILALVIFPCVFNLSLYLAKVFPDNWQYIHRERLLISLLAILLAIIGMINIPLLVSKIQQFFNKIVILIKVEGWESAFRLFLTDNEEFNTALISSLDYPIIFLVMWVAFLLYSFNRFHYFSRAITLVVLLTFGSFVLDTTKLELWCLLYPIMQVIYLTIYLGSILSFLKCYNVARYKNILAIGVTGIITLFFPVLKGGIIEPLLSSWPCVEAQGSGSSSPMSMGSDMDELAPPSPTSTDSRVSEDGGVMSESELACVNRIPCTAGAITEQTETWQGYFFPSNAKWVTTVNIAVEVEKIEERDIDIGIISNYAYYDPVATGITTLDPRCLYAVQLLMVEAELCSLADLKKANLEIDGQTSLICALPAIKSVLHQLQSADWRFLTPILNLDSTLGDRLAPSFTYLLYLPIGKYGLMHIPIRMYIGNWLDYCEGNNTIPLIMYGKPEGWFAFSPEFTISTNRPSSYMEPVDCSGGASVYEALIPYDGLFALNEDFSLDTYRFIGLYYLEEVQTKPSESSFSSEKVLEVLTSSQKSPFGKFSRSPTDLLVQMGINPDKRGMEIEASSLKAYVAKKNELGRAHFFNDPFAAEGLPRIPAYFRIDQHIVGWINIHHTVFENLALYVGVDMYEDTRGSSSLMWEPEFEDIEKNGTVVKLPDKLRNKPNLAFMELLSELSGSDEGSSVSRSPSKVVPYSRSTLEDVGYSASELGFSRTKDLRWEENFERLEVVIGLIHPDPVETTSTESRSLLGVATASHKKLRF